MRKLGRPVAWQWMDEALRQRHRHRRFDIVIACDDAAVEYLLDRGDAVLHGAPVVFCGVGNRELIRRLPRQRFTGVEEVSAASDFLDEVLKMLPSPRRLVVVTDNSPTGPEHRQFYAEIQKARPGIRFEFLDGSVLTAEDILDRLRNLDANSLVVADAFHARPARQLRQSALDGGRSGPRQRRAGGQSSCADSRPGAAGRQSECGIRPWRTGRAHGGRGARRGPSGRNSTQKTRQHPAHCR